MMKLNVWIDKMGKLNERRPEFRDIDGTSRVSISLDALRPEFHIPEWWADLDDMRMLRDWLNKILD